MEILDGYADFFERFSSWATSLWVNDSVIWGQSYTIHFTAFNGNWAWVQISDWPACALQSHLDEVKGTII